MAAIVTRLRVDLRERWRAWFAVAFLIGLAGGVVLTSAAGARRTESAYPRFLRASHGSDMLVSPNATGFPDYYNALERVTGAAVTPVIGYGVARPSHLTVPILITASPDPRWATVVERPKLTAGRMFRPDSGSEVVADVTAARALHLHPGSRMQVIVAKASEELPDPARDATITLRVVGIGVTRDSAVPVNRLALTPTLLTGPAFAHRFGSSDYAFDGAYVKLAPGTSKSRFIDTAQSLARRYAPTGGGVFIADESDQASNVERVIRPEAVALALFAVFTALTMLFAVGQLLARQLFLSSADNHVLRALGMNRVQLFVVGLVQTGTVATAGALLAVVIAVVASPIMPIGPARLAEPHPGVACDWLVLGTGFALIVGLLIAASAWPAWRAAQAGGSRPATGAKAEGPSRMAHRVATTRLPPSAAIGVGYASIPDAGERRCPSAARSPRPRSP